MFMKKYMKNNHPIFLINKINIEIIFQSISDFTTTYCPKMQNSAMLQQELSSLNPLPYSSKNHPTYYTLDQKLLLNLISKCWLLIKSSLQ
jgi:hypothetical protein